MRLKFIARVVIPLSTFGEFTTGPPAPARYSSHLQGYLNNGRNPGPGIGLKTCFFLYYKIKTYKVPNFLLFYKHDYVSVFLFVCFIAFL